MLVEYSVQIFQSLMLNLLKLLWTKFVWDALKITPFFWVLHYSCKFLPSIFINIVVQNVHYIELFTNQTYMHLFLKPELCHTEHPFSRWKFMKCPWTSGLVIGACYSCHWSQCDCFYWFQGELALLFAANTMALSKGGHPPDTWQSCSWATMADSDPQPFDHLGWTFFFFFFLLSWHEDVIHPEDISQDNCVVLRNLSQNQNLKIAYLNKKSIIQNLWQIPEDIEESKPSIKLIPLNVTDIWAQTCLIFSV